MGGSTAAGPFDPGPPRQQAVLAILATRAPHVVPMSRLIDGIWGSSAPRSAEQSVYTYVAGLRRALEPVRGPREQPTVLVGGSGGYQLRIDPRRIDSRLLTSLTAEARLFEEQGNHPSALRLIEQALALPRGVPLSGVPGPFGQNERSRLEELLTAALEQRAGLLLKLNRPEEAVTCLQDALPHHPLRERLRELLMTALNRCGRQADALEVFAEGSRILVEELGVGPGEGLRRCHELILRNTDTELPDVPRQLPRQLISFTGRTKELVYVKELLTPEKDGPPHPLVAITGPPGIGKSALALQVAHDVIEAFPGGQLFVNLRGKTVGVQALSPHDVIARFLRGLGVPAPNVPNDLDEAAALWRSQIAGRRMLVVLDDAADMHQINPLLSTPLGVSVIVTSRETLIAGDDCVQVRLKSMTEAESTAMLATLAGARRVATNPADTRHLVAFCGGLPLALRISGARLANHLDWSVADLVNRLSDEGERLTELQIGDLAVHASLASSWTAMRDSRRAADTAGARLLELLGVLHVPDVTPDFATALLGGTTAEANRALDRLVDAHLLERGHFGRFHLHDLTRLFATSLNPAGAREAAIRALTYYVVSARRASVLIDPHRTQPPGQSLDATPIPLSDGKQAREWLYSEEANLMAAATHAMSCPDETIARLGVDLAFALMWFQGSGWHLANLVSCNRQALEVAERYGDPVLTLNAHAHVAMGLDRMDLFDEAAAHRQVELGLARELNDRFAEQRAYGNLAHLYVEAGRLLDAQLCADAQLEIATEIGSAVGIRYAHMIRGYACQRLGDHEAAREALSTALSSALEVGDKAHQGAVLLILSEVCLADGHPQEAVDHLHAAIALQHATGQAAAELRSLALLARAHRLLGQFDDALEIIDKAATMARVLPQGRWTRFTLEERNLLYGELGLPVAGPT
ncbi:BTAD domain-containing putative transcriptional regulator [Nonomuraea typhae]|uniref:BTAD domain-containing putative transcriptional regulator n=1 Tax=Nonomuraea typhae TaxID=2603600 RepID=A0ABW7YP19_9ACTN